MGRESEDACRRGSLGAAPGRYAAIRSAIIFA